MKADNTYKGILKGTSIYGTIQILVILVNIVRGKFIAVILGPIGVGIQSLLQSVAGTVQTCTAFGLSFSIAKEVAAANEKDNDRDFFILYKCIQGLLLFTGILGFLFCICFSKQISSFTFGSEDYTGYIIVIAAFVFFTTLSNGEFAILQGIHHIKRISLSSIITSVLGLSIGIPIIYFWGNDGIPYSLTSMVVVSFCLYYYNVRKTRRISETYSIQFKEFKPIIRLLLGLGAIMMIAQVLGFVRNYTFNIYVRTYGTLFDIGLIQAALTITNQYISTVFNALNMDYLPRLSAMSSSNDSLNLIVNRQVKLMLVLISPLAILMILFAPLIIKLLLSDEFIILISVIRWMALGVFFRGISYSMGTIAIAKGDKYFFVFFDGFFSNILQLVLDIVFYKYFGVIGIGYSFVLYFAISVCLYTIFTRLRYSLLLDREMLRMSFIYLVLLSSMLILSYMSGAISFIIEILLVSCVVYYSYAKLNNYIDIKQTLNDLKNKLTKKC